MNSLVTKIVRRAMSACIGLALVAGAGLAADAPLDRTKPPVLGPLKPLKLPVAQTQTLANGLQLAVVEMHRVPVVDCVLLVRAGAAYDPPESPGLATFVANMLDEGAGKRSALEISEEADFLGAQFNTVAGMDNAQVYLHVPRARLAEALDLMADVALRPAFPDSEIVRQRELRKNNILQLRDQPTAMAPLAFHAILFGVGHPYGHPQGGTDVSTAALDRARVTRFHEAHYRPGNAKLLFVGDITPAEARTLAEARFGGWAKGAVPAPPASVVPAPAARTFYLVDKPGAPQSVVLIGNLGVPRSTPDYYALRVMNNLLGGSFTSRLNQNLRELHGYTYGVRTSFDMYRQAGPFRATSSVHTAKTDSALIEFFRELRRVRDEPVPGEELAKSKAYIALGLPGEFETTQGAAGRFLDLLAYDLPLDSYDSFIDGIEAVTAEDVQRVARQYITPDQSVIVVVGDRSQIEAGIQALNEGRVEPRDLWGQPAP
jgi:predicted Zn-dependent peptidase